jgi:hypothetical protein
VPSCAIAFRGDRSGVLDCVAVGQWPSGSCDCFILLRPAIERDHQDMNRNILYLVVGALVVAAGVFGYMLYQERQKTTGIEINVGKSGVSIEKK